MPVDRKFHPRIGDSEKIAKLTDMEFRVWFTYVMVADDFGVLPMVPAKIKAGDRTLANRAPKQIARALDTLAEIGLVRVFDHQGARYVWSKNWQEHQEIRYPRREQTHYPAPPESDLRALDGDEERSTRELFATFHLKVSEALRREFGDADAIAKIVEREQKRLESKPRRSRDITGTFPEHSGTVATLTRARAPETANGLRLLSTGGAGGRALPEGPAYDQWFQSFQALYPGPGRARGPLAMQAFLEVFMVDTREPEVIWAEMQTSVRGYAASPVVRDGKVKNMIGWLREGYYAQRHDDPKPRPSGPEYRAVRAPRPTSTETA